ncbi:hypothetical protein [Flavobacterium sp.]
MKSPKSIAAFLGITQEDLSLLFGGHRSQFSRYGSGLRKLPLRVMRVIADVIQHLQHPDTHKNSNAARQQLMVKQHAIAEMIADNVAATARIKLRLPGAQAKHAYYLNGMKSLEFLADSELASDETNAAILRSITRKTGNGLRAFGSDTLFRLEHRLEMLELEKLVLDSKLRKLQQTRENIEGK